MKEGGEPAWLFAVDVEQDVALAMSGSHGDLFGGAQVRLAIRVAVLEFDRRSVWPAQT